MGTLLIHNAAAVITPREVIPNGSVFIEGNVIVEVGPNIVRPADHVIDASGKVVIPGLVNTHHHLYQTFQRNLPRVQNVGLFDWLTTLYEIWREITPDVARVSALLGMAELLKTGCTTTTDHFYVFPRGMPGTLIDETINAAATIGIRFHPCRGSMSLGRSQGGLPPDDIVQDEETILADSRRLIERYHDPSRYAMLRIALAPCSPFSVTPALMRETVKLARESGVRCHTHLAETLDEEAFCQEKLGCRPFEFMEELGWVGPEVWFAHAIYLSEREIEVMGRTGTGVAHCPTSNLRLGSGICPVPEMRANRVPVGLAVDGSASNDSSNMLLEARMALLVHRYPGTSAGWARNRSRLHEAAIPPPTTAADVLELATIGGARVLGRDDIGEIATGKGADLVLIDLNQIGYAGGLHDPLGALLFAGTSQVVDTVIVNGKIVVQDGTLAHVSEKNLVEEANRLSREMLERATRRTGIDFLAPLR